MKLLVLMMLGQLLQQNILVNKDFMAGGPCHVLTMALAICKGHAALSHLGDSLLSCSVPGPIVIASGFQISAQRIECKMHTKVHAAHGLQ